MAQLAGAAAAALLLRELLPSEPAEAVYLGVPALGHEVHAGAGVVLEGILTFLLVTVVFGTAVDPKGAFKSIAALMIGLTITIDILFGGPFTGAAMNPSRAFGPQLVGNHWSNGWVWYAGPLVGGAIAAVLYSGCTCPDAPPRSRRRKPRASPNKRVAQLAAGRLAGPLYNQTLLPYPGPPWAAPPASTWPATARPPITSRAVSRASSRCRSTTPAAPRPPNWLSGLAVGRVGFP